MKLSLIRHGESMGNTPRKIPTNPWGNLNFLTLKGHRQAQACGTEMLERGMTEWDRVFCSTMVRSQQTANVILQTLDVHDRYETVVTPFLDEWWDNPRGKTTVQFQEQINSFMAILMPLWNTDAHVMVVSHGYTTRAIMNYIDVATGVTDELANSIHDIQYHAPNAVPYFYDTLSPQPFKYTIPGLHSFKNA